MSSILATIKRTAMFRALSTLKSSYGYKRLHGESFSRGTLPEPGLTRVKSMPARKCGIPKKVTQEALNPTVKPTTKRSKKNKIHPMFGLFNRRRNKMSFKPELMRYMAYLKEGGRWDNKDTTAPVIYWTN